MERIERSLKTKEKETEIPKVGEHPKVEERRGEVELLGASTETRASRARQGEVEEEERKRESRYLREPESEADSGEALMLWVFLECGSFDRTFSSSSCSERA